MKTRYFLAQDDSCHWYLVPANKREEWNEWRDIPEDDPRGWEGPEWAKLLGTCPSLITFTNPVEEKYEDTL